MRYFDSEGNVRDNQASLFLNEATGFLRRKGNQVKEDVKQGIKEIKEMRVHTDVMPGPPLPDEEFIHLCIEEAKAEYKKLTAFTCDVKLEALSPQQINKFNSLVIAAAINKDPILMKECSSELVEKILQCVSLEMSSNIKIINSADEFPKHADN